jgi:hypothetical protein
LYKIIGEDDEIRQILTAATIALMAVTLTTEAWQTSTRMTRVIAGTIGHFASWESLNDEEIKGHHEMFFYYSRG